MSVFAVDGSSLKRLRVVFIGSPRFSVPSLDRLASSGHEVVLVVTGPDRPAGRGLRSRPSAVRAAAGRLSLPVETVPPEDRAGLADLLERIGPDIIATVAWSGLLDSRSLGAARVAALNVHPSLLPRYRGAAPVQRAILAGEERFGVTVMHLARQLDAGDIVSQREVPVPPGADAGRVEGLLAAAGADLLVESIAMFARGKAPRVPQDESAATWAPKLTPEDERITWEMAAEEIVLRVRALSPDPGAYFAFGGRRVKIIGVRACRTAVPPPGAGGAGAGRGVTGAARGSRGAGSPEPGTIIGRDGRSLAVRAGDGTMVFLERVKPEGGREISGVDFANGRRLAPGNSLSWGG